MNINNPKTEVPYWDDGQRGQLYRWYQKGFWKRYLRKKYIKNRLKDIEE
jgi:hypothetical protein